MAFDENMKLLLLAITLPLSLASFSQQQWYKHNLDLTAGGGLQSIQFNPEKGDQKPLLGACKLIATSAQMTRRTKSINTPITRITALPSNIPSHVGPLTASATPDPI